MKIKAISHAQASPSADTYAFFFDPEIFSYLYESDLDEDRLLKQIAQSLYDQHFKQFPYYISRVFPKKTGGYEILFLDGINLTKAEFSLSAANESLALLTNIECIDPTIHLPQSFNSPSISNLLNETIADYNKECIKVFLSGESTVPSKCLPMPERSRPFSEIDYTPDKADTIFREVANTFKCLKERQQQYTDYKNGITEQLTRAETQLECSKKEASGIAAYTLSQFNLLQEKLAPKLALATTKEINLQTTISELEHSLIEKWTDISNQQASLIDLKKNLAWTLYHAAGTCFKHMQEKKGVNRKEEIDKLNDAFSGFVKFHYNGGMSDIDSLYEIFARTPLITVKSFVELLLGRSIRFTNDIQHMLKKTFPKTDLFSYTKTTFLWNPKLLAQENTIREIVFHQNELLAHQLHLALNIDTQTEDETFITQVNIDCQAFHHAIAEHHAFRRIHQEALADKQRAQELVDYLEQLFLESELTATEIQAHIPTLLSSISSHVLAIRRIIDTAEYYSAEPASVTINEHLLRIKERVATLQTYHHSFEAKVKQYKLDQCREMALAKEKQSSQENLSEWVTAQPIVKRSVSLPSDFFRPPTLPTLTRIKATGFFRRHLGKIIGGLSGFALGAIIGGILGAALAPFTCGASVPFLAAVVGTIVSIASAAIGVEIGACRDDARRAIIAVRDEERVELDRPVQNRSDLFTPLERVENKWRRASVDSNLPSLHASRETLYGRSIYMPPMPAPLLSAPRAGIKFR